MRVIQHLKQGRDTVQITFTNYMFVFNALHIYKKKLLMVLRTFYEMENVFYIDPCISKSEFNLGVLEDFLVKIRDF